VTWSDPARVEQLKTLWADGLSASQVAARLGVTRGMVTGKVHRLGLNRPKPIHPRRTVPRPRPMPAALIPAQRGRDQRGHLEPLPLPPPAATDTPRVSLLDASDSACRWPCAEIEAVAAGLPYYCGLKKVPGLPYCPDHARRAFATPPVSVQEVTVVPVHELEPTA
jgi:GcrA cell cycle regulator